MFHSLALVIHKQVGLYYFEKLFSSVVPVILRSHVYPQRQKILFISFNENIPEVYILQIKSKWLSYTDILAMNFYKDPTLKDLLPLKMKSVHIWTALQFYTTTVEWYMEELHIVVLTFFLKIFLKTI